MELDFAFVFPGNFRLVVGALWLLGNLCSTGVLCECRRPREAQPTAVAGRNVVLLGVPNAALTLCWLPSADDGR